MNHNPDVVRQVQLETGEDPALILNVWNTTMGLVEAHISEGLFPTIRIPHLGKFKPNYRYMNSINLKRILPKPDESI